MSVQAMSWVIEKSDQKGSNLLVLLMIANHADTTGMHAYPAVTTLAAESRLTERGVRYILAKLAPHSAAATATPAGENPDELIIERDAGPRGTHLYSLPGVIRDGFNLRGLPANFAGRKQEGKSSACGNLPAKSDTSTGKSFAPEPKRTETKSQNLRPLPRPSPPACGNLGPNDSGKSPKRWPGKGKCQNETTTTPQQRRYAIVRRLTNAAAEILNRKPNYPLGELAEDVKQWAANEGIPYFDAWPGAATPVQQAISLALERRKTA